MSLITPGAPRTRGRVAYFQRIPRIHPQYITVTLMFGVMLLLIPILSLPYHNGLHGGDAGWYLKYAFGLLHGNVADQVTENVFANRIGTYTPYALGMLIGGEGTWLSWIPTVQFMGLVIIIYACLVRWNLSVAGMAALMLGVSRILYEWSGVTMGDITITIMANLPVLVYFGYHRSPDGKRPVVWGVCIGLLLVAAVMTKESIAFYFPFLAYLAYRDWHQPERRRLWKSIAVVLALGGLWTLVWYGITTGDALFRLHIVSGPSASDCNYLGASWFTVLKRLTYEPFEFLVSHEGFGILLLLSLLNLVKGVRIPYERFFHGLLLVTLGMWWLGTQSFTFWNPVALVYRIWLPLMVPLALNAALFLYAVITTSFTRVALWRMSVVLVVFLGATGLSLWHASGLYDELGLYNNLLWIGLKYVVIGSAVLVILWTPESWVPMFLPRLRNLAFGIIWGLQLVSLVLFLVWHVITPRESRYEQEKASLVMVEDIEGPILTNEVLATTSGIYTGFGNLLPFVDWANVDTIVPGTYLYISLLNLEDQQQGLSETLIYTEARNVIPPYVLNPEEYGFCLVDGNETHRLYRYAVDRYPLIREEIMGQSE